MGKSSLILSIVLSLAFILSSCNSYGEKQNSSSEKEQKPVQITSVEVSDSVLPALEGFNKNLTEIDIEHSSDGYLSNFSPIKIKDKKIISDILSMLEKSKLVEDDSKLNKMSGMAARNNKLILINSQNGTRVELFFAFDDPAFATGYLEFEGKKYDPGYSLFRYLDDFTEYRKHDTDLDKQVVELFKNYDWTVDYRINEVKETLPTNLKHEAGEYPVKIYWAYNNELSKSIGLDYSTYLGKNIDVEIYRLREQLPNYLSPRMEARGIVLKSNNKIIGAFIDSGRHDSFACSLDRKNLKTLTGKDWDAWVGGYVDYGNDLELKLSKASPDDVIKLYFDAIDRQDEKTEYACLTRKYLCSFIAMNMDNNKLFNESFSSAYIDGENNIKSAKLIKVREFNMRGNPEGTIEYEAIVDLDFVKEITSLSGRQSRFMIIKKESEKSGWRIESIGTGP